MAEVQIVDQPILVGIDLSVGNAHGSGFDRLIRRGVNHELPLVISRSQSYLLTATIEIALYLPKKADRLADGRQSGHSLLLVIFRIVMMEFNHHAI